MSIWTKIRDTLKTPDDQQDDWYGWVTNQLSHILIGLIITSIFCFIISPLVGFYFVLIYIVIKEILDLLMKFNLEYIRDSINDIIFQVSGSWIAIGLYENSIKLFIISMLLSFTLSINGIMVRIKNKTGDNRIWMDSILKKGL